ncbi:MAG: hypothetical protein QOE90_532 [Thermoplasmata archaeon]|jgi:hypothetical protein|nr:hypothetical protein [Thermoplasmata archaeon]
MTFQNPFLPRVAPRTSCPFCAGFAGQGALCNLCARAARGVRP